MAISFRTYFTNQTSTLNRNDRAFLRWMDKIEEVVFFESGMLLREHPDQAYRDNFEIGLTSDEMAKIVLDTYFKTVEFVSELFPEYRHYLVY